MSITNTTNKIYGDGNGVTQIFSFPFKIFSETQLVVYLIDEDGTVLDPLTLNTDYTVYIDPVNEGGLVTFLVAPPSGYQYFIRRNLEYTQNAVIPSEGALPGKQIENQLDLGVMLAIQNADLMSRALLMPETYLGVVPTLPDPESGKVLAWDAYGNIVNITAAAKGDKGDTGATGPAGPVGSGSGDVLGPASNHDAYVPVWNGADTKTLADGIPVGVTAGCLVQLDGDAKLPEIDGSQLTGVNALTLLGLTAGTSANNLLKLGADAKVPPANIFTADWTDYSDTSTIVGWSSFDTKSIWYSKIGTWVFVQFTLIGTSNSNPTSFSLPFAADGSIYVPETTIRCADFGATTPWTIGILGVSSSTVLLYPSPAAGNWTTGSKKHCYGQFFYKSAT